MKTGLFALAALALTLAACNNDNENLNDGPVAAKFTAGITPVTRASGTTWNDGDRIGITGIGTDYDNVPYILKKKGTFEAEGNAIYFNSTTEVKFRAYYPYNPTGGKFTVTTDAAAQKDQPAIDFLFASGATGSTYNPEVKFTDKTNDGGPDNSFHHRMSQITLTFKAGLGVDFDAATPDEYTLSGLKLDGTFDTASGTAAVGDQAQAKELTIPLDGAVQSSIILIPQEANTLSLTVVYNAENYHATLTVPKGALQAGDNYSYTVKLNNKDLEVSTAEITNWKDVEPVNVNVNL